MAATATRQTARRSAQHPRPPATCAPGRQDSRSRTPGEFGRRASATWETRRGAAACRPSATMSGGRAISAGRKLARAPDDLPRYSGSSWSTSDAAAVAEAPQHCSQLCRAIRQSATSRRSDRSPDRSWCSCWTRESPEKKCRVPAARHCEREIGKEHHRSLLEHGRDARYGRAIWCSPARVRDRSKSTQSSSSSPHGDGCGPGTMPAISGSSSPSARGSCRLDAFAVARRSSFCLRFSCRARSFARFSSVGLVRFATLPPPVVMYHRQESSGSTGCRARVLHDEQS